MVQSLLSCPPKRDRKTRCVNEIFMIFRERLRSRYWWCPCSDHKRYVFSFHVPILGNTKSNSNLKDVGDMLDPVVAVSRGPSLGDEFRDCLEGFSYQLLSVVSRKTRFCIKMPRKLGNFRNTLEFIQCSIYTAKEQQQNHLILCKGTREKKPTQSHGAINSAFTTYLRAWLL